MPAQTMNQGRVDTMVADRWHSIPYRARRWPPVPIQQLVLDCRIRQCPKHIFQKNADSSTPTTCWSNDANSSLWVIAMAMPLSPNLSNMSPFNIWLPINSNKAKCWIFFDLNTTPIDLYIWIALCHDKLSTGGVDLRRLFKSRVERSTSKWFFVSKGIWFSWPRGCLKWWLWIWCEVQSLRYR